MSKIVVLGATGFVGTALCLRLLDQGHQVLALARRPQEWPLQHQNLQIITADLTSYQHLDKILKGADAAFYLVHSLAEDERDFEFLEARAATVFAKAAAQVKLRRVVYLSSLGSEGEHSSYLRSRQLVGEILALVPGSTLELRASIVLGANSASFEMIKALAQRLPVRPYAPWLETPCQPIALQDLLSYMTAALELELLGHTVVEVGGSSVVSYGEMLDMAMKLEEVQRPKLLLPSIDQRLLFPAIDLLLPEFPEIAKKLFLALSNPTVVTDNKAAELFPEIVPRDVKTALELAYVESSTAYPAVWEGDFWKEMGEQTLLQGRQGQKILLEKMRQLKARYPDRLLRRWPKRKRS